MQRGAWQQKRAHSPSPKMRHTTSALQFRLTEMQYSPSTIAIHGFHLVYGDDPRLVRAQKALGGQQAFELMYALEIK